MKRIFSILFALLLAVSLMLVPATVSADGTVSVTVELNDSEGNPLSGGYVEFRGKPDSPTEWSSFGTTGEDGTAELSLNASKWEYWFSVKYNDTYAKIKQDIGVNSTVSFTTTSVTLGFSGDITYNSRVEPGTWVTFDNSMEMLPHNYAFRFGDEGEGYPWASVAIEVSGDSVVKTVAYIRLLNSDGTPQPNYTASWMKYGAPPYAPVAGTPDANGVLLNVMDGYNDTHYAYHRVEYLNAQSYPPGLAQIPALDSFYDFQLTKVEVQLKDHAGNLISGTGPDVYVYTHYSGAGGEILFGTLNNGTVSLDLLQGYRHYFTIKDYNGTKKMIWQDNLTNPVVFQTFLVLDNGWGCTHYYQHNQMPWGQTFPSSGQVELLPDIRTYYKNYLNATQWFDVPAGKTLDLFTGLVTP